MQKRQFLISIVIPVYNSQDFIKETIKSVKNQTHTNWELILIDDKSTDNSLNIIISESQKDQRIIILKNEKNLGVAMTRNKGVSAAKGDFIAFLDADDSWLPNKIEDQLNFMCKNKSTFSFTGYCFINKNKKGKNVYVPFKISLKNSYKNHIIWTSTVMIDLRSISKNNIMMPEIREVGEDTLTWWKILKKVDYAYGLNKTLSYYHRRKNTLTSNKITALKHSWRLYKKYEKMSTIKSLYYLTFYIFNAFKKRI